MSLLSVPGYQLQPSAEQVPLSSNYLMQQVQRQ